jgi:YidC/Oxa1 family membrane protein insertase
MEQRRFILFLVLSMAVLIGWTNFVMPLKFPPQPEPAEQQADEEAAKDEQDGPKAEDEGVIAGEDNRQPDDANRDDANRDQANRDDANRDDANKPPEVADVAKLKGGHEHKTIRLGSLNPNSGYYLYVSVSTLGASVSQIELNDYWELTNRDAPLKLVGNTDTLLKTLETSVPQIDEQLLAKYGVSLKNVDWDVLEEVTDPQDNDVISGVTFVYTSPDGRFEVQKRFALTKVDRYDREARDTDAGGYLLHFEQTIKNLTDKEQIVSYTLQGPVGLPLENKENAHLFRGVQKGSLDADEKNLPPAERSVTTESMTAETIADHEAENELQKWSRPIKYIGVDVQYFAALLIPVDDQLQTPYIKMAEPVLVERNAEKDKWSDVSVLLTSDDFTLQGKEELTHVYRLYAGPKRLALLDAEEVGAPDVMNYGWFGVVSKAMIKLLTFLHNSWGFPYGIAIICLTVLVRGCMFPLSRKQAAGAKKMKELQPEIAVLREKHKNKKEDMAKAQMELFRKNKYNPLAGCLPIFMQFPIFIGLYQGLNNAVDLRMAPFLWIDNLAAPDALFRMPFKLPFLGADFNLLPLITVALFVVQQKMFMPPPAPDDDQAKMQAKMMNYMMIFFGFMFYTMPAGLCVYFIASSLWGLGERKMLDFAKSKPSSTDEPADQALPEKKKGGPDKKNDGKEKVSKSLWSKLVASAEAAAEQAKTNGSSGSSKSANGSKSSDSKKKKRKSRPRR